MKYLLILILINFLLNNEIKALGLNDYDSFDLAENEIEIKKTPEELVEEITNRFDKLAETSVDYAEKLKLIKETSAAFLKLAIPFGALLTASLDITGKTESDEYKALKKMNNHMVYQFDRLTERITYSFEAEEMDTELREFDNFITLQLNVLAKEVLYFTDPSIAKTNEAIIDLLSYCRGSNGIVKMAEYMRKRISIGCSLDNTKVYEKITKIFINLEDHFNITTWNAHQKKLKKKIINAVYSMPAYKTIQILEDIELIINDFETFGKAIEHIYSVTKHKKLPDPSRCLTDAVVNGNKYNRNNVSFFETLVQIELSRLLIASTLCGKFMFPTDQARFDAFLTNVGNEVSRTSQFLANYIPSKLNMSGAAERLIIAETIKQFPGTGDIPHPEFNTLVNLLYESLKHIGHKRIEKQILIYPSEESIKQYNGISICPEYYCDIILNQRGVNVVIARFNKDNVFLAKSLQIRVGELKPKIVNVLKEKYYLDLKELLGQFKSNNIFLVDQYLTKTASIVRHKTFCSVACTYFATTKSYQREKYELPFLDYFVYNNGRDRGWFEDNTCYAIYFFL